MTANDRFVVLFLPSTLVLFGVLCLFLYTLETGSIDTEPLKQSRELLFNGMLLLVFFMVSFLMLVLSAMRKISSLFKIASFSGIVIILIDIVLMFAAYFFIISVDHEPVSVFDALFLSVMTFAGAESGVSYFSNEMKLLVMIETLLGFLFLPILLTAAFVVTQKT